MLYGDVIENVNLNYQFFEIVFWVADLVIFDFMVSLVVLDEVISFDISNYWGNVKMDEIGCYNYFFEINFFGIQFNIVDGFVVQDVFILLFIYQENFLIFVEVGFWVEGFEVGFIYLNEFWAYMVVGGYFINVDMANIQYEVYEIVDFENGGIENLDGISMDDVLFCEILEECYIILFGQIEGFNDICWMMRELVVWVFVVLNIGI